MQCVLEYLVKLYFFKYNLWLKTQIIGISILQMVLFLSLQNMTHVWKVALE